MSNKNLLIAALSSFTLAGSAVAVPIASFDLEDTNDANPIITQTDFTSATGNGAFVDGSVTMTISGIAAGRARGVAATLGGVDNGDNPVPEGDFSALYQDFLFGTGSSATFALSGLDADTDYFVTVVSYGSGQGGTTSAEWSAGGGTLATTSFQGDLAGPGPDPFTDSISDYAETFTVTTDGSGDVTVTATSVSGIILVNGLTVEAVPEPSSLALIGLGGLAMLRRRRA